MNGGAEETTFTREMTGGLCELRLLHPPGTFAPTPASLVALEAIGKHRELLTDQGLDWGSGIGCLAIAAARVPAVQRIVGLEISDANVAIARTNAQQNGVSDKAAFVLSDSYLPRAVGDRAVLKELEGRVNFILANPPSSEGDDGFGYRRIVLRGARSYLIPGGVILLNISYQYGQRRVEGLCQDAPGFVYGGVLASTDWVPFDVNRPDLLQCLHWYAVEESRGGFNYTFRNPGAGDEKAMNAQAALVHYERTGQSPLSKWQTHLFVFKPA
jgi:hypothetical protein